MNHSCEPNAVCEKWSVPKTPGDISRIGFFAKKSIKAGEEITFDYQFVNYGREAQQCFCGAPSCNGWIGTKLEDSDDDDDDNCSTSSRHIEMDDETEEKLEELNDLEPHQQIVLIDRMLQNLYSSKKDKKTERKVITIAVSCY